jgi:hypothetical protein
MFALYGENFLRWTVTKLGVVFSKDLIGIVGFGSLKYIDYTIKHKKLI